MIVETNALFYAVDEQSHFYTSVQLWLEEVMNGVECGTAVGIPDGVPTCHHPPTGKREPAEACGRVAVHL